MNPFAHMLGWLRRDRVAAASAQAAACTCRPLSGGSVLRVPGCTTHPHLLEVPYIQVSGQITEENAAVLRDQLRADLERIIYSGDHPKCGDCTVGFWQEDNHVTPCAAYPACSTPAPRLRLVTDRTEAER